MYDDPVIALRSAYRAMATDTTVVSQLWNDLIGGVVSDKSELTKWERVAQGVFTLSLAKKHARLHSRYLLKAVYYPPIKEFNSDKELSCKLASYYIYEQLQKRIDRWFIDDLTRHYCGLKQHHTEDWWSDHIHRSDRQIRRYKNEKVLPLLDGLHDQLIEDISPAFTENGIIER